MAAINIQDLITSLRGYFWHSTSVNGASAILTDSAIRVNRTGTFPFSYSQSAVSNCVSLGGVSLFDFVTHSDRDIIGDDLLLSDKWPDVLMRHRPCTVAFGFKLCDVAESLLFYPEMKQLDGFGGTIPRVESCHLGDLSVRRASAFGFCFPERESKFTVKAVSFEELQKEVDGVCEIAAKEKRPNQSSQHNAMAQLFSVLQSRSSRG